MAFEVESLRKILESIPDDNEREEAYRILYGKKCGEMEFPESIHELAKKSSFELKGYIFTAAPEELRPPRITR